MNMMDKCTNFHEHVDTPSGYMITQLIPARAGLEKNFLCHSPQWNHSQKISRQTGTRTQNLVAKAEHQSEQLQNGAKKKTRELQIFFVVRWAAKGVADFPPIAYARNRN